MKPHRTTTGLLLLVVLAAIGFLLVYMPGKLAEQYYLVQEAGPVWVTVYFSVVGTGALILLSATLWILGRLWWRLRAKAARRQRRDKNPSELSADAKNREIDENLATITDLQDDAATAELRREVAPLIRQLEQKREKQTLEIVAFGTVSSGKSSLLNALAGRDVFATDAPEGPHYSETRFRGRGSIACCWLTPRGWVRCTARNMRKSQPTRPRMPIWCCW